MVEQLTAYEPLYLKWRPQRLADLVGQEAVQQTLKNAIVNDRLSHAYLFTGPRGTGKTSSARILAKSINCEQGSTVDPCLKCASCMEIAHGTSPAVFELDAASNNSVDDARQLIERAPLVAVSGRYKLYIIDECHMLTKEAFNALLKTIEEPPDRVIFILATTEEHKVPPTIISRCQKLLFRLVSQDALSGHLRKVADSEGINIDDDALRLIARRSGGGLRDAVSLLDQSSLLASSEHAVGVNDLLQLLGAVHEDVLLEISQAILNRDGKATIFSAQKLIEEGRDPAIIVQELARHFINLSKAAYMHFDGQSEPEPGSVEQFILGSKEYLQKLCKQACLFERSELSQIVEHLDRLEQTTRRTTQPVINLEAGLLAICHRHEIHLIRELEERVARLETQLSRDDIQFALESVDRQDEVNKSAQRNSPPMLSHSVPTGSVSVDAERRNSERIEEGRIVPAKAEVEHKEALNVAQDRQVVESIVEAQAIESRSDNEPKEELESASNLVEEDSTAFSKTSSSDLEMESFWSELLDEVQRLSPPTYGTLAVYPFPLELTDKTFTIGVPNSMWQQNVERKLDKIQSICQKIAGNSLQVRVKIIESKPTPQKPKSKPAVVAARTNVQQEHHKPLDSDDVEPEPAVAGDQVNLNLEERYTSEDENKEPVRAAATKLVKSAAGMPVSETASSLTGTSIQEVYKLFEGPGSRLIG